MIVLEFNDTMILTKVFVYSFLVLKIVFYNEPFFSVLNYAIALGVITYIPGYLLTKKLLEHDEQRLLFGSMISLTIIGVASYYLGLLGMHLNLTSFLLPALLITTGLILTWKKK